RSPRGTPAHGGAGMLSLLSGAKILPGAVVTRRYRVRPFCRVELNFGEAKTYVSSAESRGDAARAISEEVFADICRLAEEAETRV
ncbi:MAG: hypothetical protein II776_01280, partial [Clostridia bacterium]|nr:hypothetical protein [Clostridia bacterium]